MIAKKCRQPQRRRCLPARARAAAARRPAAWMGGWGEGINRKHPSTSHMRMGDLLGKTVNGLEF
jgi:hypothetical protein